MNPLILAGLILIGPQGESHAAAGSPATTLSFNGVTYHHRWSSQAQNEYTPQGEEDLEAWKSMVTLNVHDWARNGEQLAELANRVLGNYQATAKVLRTDSKPRTKEREAEHFAAVLFGRPNFLEAAFARVVLVEGRGVVIVYSKRFYGAAVGNEMSAWLGKNGPPVEKALMAWTGMPSLAALAALPQAKPVKVTDVEVGRAVGANKKISDKTDTFKPTDTIYVSVATEGSSPGAALVAHWTYKDGQVVKHDETTIALTGNAVTEFHIAKPSGWPVGDYKVEVMLDGASAGAKSFKVAK